MKKLLNTLYITTKDSYLSLQNNAVAVLIGGEEKVRIPANTLGSICCFGNTSVSSPLIAFCGENGISLSFFSDYGKFYGRVEGPVHGNVLLRQSQYRTVDLPEVKTALVQSVLLGKILNSKECLTRWKREIPEQNGIFDKSIAILTDTAHQLKNCFDVDSMRGLEGIAAAAYFQGFAAAIRPPKQGSRIFRFDGRNRRPPEDPVNALLSFLYTLLKNDYQSALEGVGLDPAVGYLHTLRPGRPALALDMMEELRAPLCDRLALSLINRGQITENDFVSLNAPVLLTDIGRKTVLSVWQKRKMETIRHPFLQETVSIGLIPHAQAMLMARVLRGELDAYPPFHWR